MRFKTISDNRKVRNATKNHYDRIDFKSKLEKDVYTVMKDHGIKAEYEKHTYTLCESKQPTVPFYTSTKSKGFHLEMKVLSSITYTPDFQFVWDNDITVIVEVKGFMNDIYPLKRNLFRHYVLERIETDNNFLFFEIKSRGDAIRMIGILNDIKKDREKFTLLKYTLGLPKKYISKLLQYLEEGSMEQYFKKISKIQNIISESCTEINTRT